MKIRLKFIQKNPDCKVYAMLIYDLTPTYTSLTYGVETNKIN